MKGTTSEPRTVRIDSGDAVLHGDFAAPAGSRGVILFAHGSGSSRHSPRNRFVAESLRDSGFGTLLLDLLTEQEEQYDLRTRALRFDVDLLARRLSSAIDWLNGQPARVPVSIGLFGASTGAAAALIAASLRPSHVHAVVSRGGRPDLAGPALQGVRAPTLLIVGGDDVPVIELNREALSELKATKRIEIVAGATHLFEEPGALEQVARLASSWFRKYLRE
jgi:putative phosphoribosyl transferase